MIHKLNQSKEGIEFSVDSLWSPQKQRQREIAIKACAPLSHTIHQNATQGGVWLVFSAKLKDIGTRD